MINPPGSAPPGPRLIGLVGGTGWLSTLEYYRLINQGINRALGGHEAARCVLYSLNFGDIMRIKVLDPEQAAERELVVDAARTVANAGAECVVICANTLHWFAEAVADAVPVPLIHIATLVPEAGDRAFVDRAILHELVQEIFRDEVKARFLGIMAELGRRGAEGIILGCTEIPLLIKPGETDRPMFDTLRIHAQAAVDFALGA